jgi:hypothetical protein
VWRAIILLIGLIDEHFSGIADLGLLRRKNLAITISDRIAQANNWAYYFLKRVSVVIDNYASGNSHNIYTVKSVPMRIVLRARTLANPKPGVKLRISDEYCEDTLTFLAIQLGQICFFVLKRMAMYVEATVNVPKGQGSRDAQTLLACRSELADLLNCVYLEELSAQSLYRKLEILDWEQRIRDASSRLVNDVNLPTASLMAAYCELARGNDNTATLDFVDTVSYALQTLDFLIVNNSFERSEYEKFLQLLDRRLMSLRLEVLSGRYPLIPLWAVDVVEEWERLVHPIFPRKKSDGRPCVFPSRR